MDEQLLDKARDLMRGAPGAPPAPERALALLERAAEGGDAEAMVRCAVFAAGGIGQKQDWPKAIELLRRAAAAGSADADAQLAILADGAGEIDLEALLTPPPLERLSDTAPVGVARGFAPPGFSARLIAHGRERLTPAVASDSATGKYVVKSVRTATNANFGSLRRDLVVAVLQERAARLTGVPVSHHEAPMLLSYEVGQRFDAHFDFVPPRLPAMAAELRILGQRSTTLVTYLNEDFEGGATQFPTLGIEFRGREGDALVFSNVLPDGAPDRRMLHAGTPPTAGRKWVLSQWLRTLPQTLR